MTARNRGTHSKAAYSDARAAIDARLHQARERRSDLGSRRMVGRLCAEAVDQEIIAQRARAASSVALDQRNGSGRGGERDAQQAQRHERARPAILDPGLARAAGHVVSHGLSVVRHGVQVTGHRRRVARHRHGVVMSGSWSAKHGSRQRREQKPGRDQQHHHSIGEPFQEHAPLSHVTAEPANWPAITIWPARYGKAPARG